ncbi:MAG: hypothetical protein K9N51_13675, partial [Candidatus Pacebacteria bacterium]|nr:hypothetical protein [Candidatus Paceibacterota bacterium]
EKLPYSAATRRRDMFLDAFFILADVYGWQPQAWAVLPNHYHFIAVSPEKADTLGEWLDRLHALTATAWNREDRAVRRKVWYQSNNSKLTHQTSYLAALKYVHRNPVEHGLVEDPTGYKWCSMGWLQEQGSDILRKTLEGFKTARPNVYDDF